MTGPPSRVRPGRAAAVPAHLLASAVLALATIGDSLFYAIVPAAASHYGLSPAGIGLVLSVNRFVRLGCNPFVARWLARRGLRRGAITGAALALISTTAYAVAPGVVVLAAARAAWGVAFSLLRLAMLGFATVELARAPARLGAAAAIQAVVPAAMLLVGTSLLGQVGPRFVFAGLATLTVLALPLALLLPGGDERARSSLATSPSPGRAAPPGISRPVAVTAAVSFAADGLVTAGIVLALVARGVPAPEAAVMGGVVLAARKALQVVIAPIAGRAAQRVGLTPVVALGLLAAAIGLGVAAAGSVVVGALLTVSAAAVVLTLAPAAIVADSHVERMRGLAWVTTARDLGAAIGAAVVPLLLVGGDADARTSWTFAATAVVVVVAAGVWLRDRRRAV